MTEILKESAQTVDRFTVISDLHNNEKRVLFLAGNRQLSQTFPEKVYSIQIPKNLEYIFLISSWNFKGIELFAQFEIFKN